MKGGAIGRRYAKAFLDLAQAQNKVDESLCELETVEKVFSGCPEFQFLMTDPAFGTSERKKAVEALAPKLQLSPLMLNFLKILIDRERIIYFSEILLSYRDQADAALGRVRVQVTVQGDLEEASKEPLKKALEKLSQQQVILEVKTDPQILGGMIIQMKDLVLNGSAKSNLERIKEKMLQASVGNQM